MHSCVHNVPFTHMGLADTNVTIVAQQFYKFLPLLETHLSVGFVQANSETLRENIFEGLFHEQISGFIAIYTNNNSIDIWVLLAG